MKFPGFIGPSYTLQSVNLDAQRTINLIPQVNETGRGKEQEVINFIGTPGLTLKVTLGDGPIRGIYTASNDVLYAVSGNRIYSISSSYVGSSLGILDTSTGPVSFADNGTSLVCVDGTSGYVVTLSDNSFVKITDGDFEPADKVVFLDGRFVFNASGTGRIFNSDLNAVTIPSDTATAEGDPDNIVSLIADHRELWLFGTDSIEVFYNAGTSPFTFARSEGAFVEHGCAAAFSVAKMNNEVFWLGQDEQGTGIIYKANGYQPQRISTHAVEYAISQYSSVSDAVAYTYQENGHDYYIINFTDAETSWCYDATTNLWHERAYFNDGSFERHRANCHAFAYGAHLVGDYANGKIYQMSSLAYSDAGDEIRRLRAAPHLSSSLKNVFYHLFQLDMEVGVGLDGATTTQGHDPQVMLQWSDDGGHSWKAERWKSIGKIGKRKQRLIWRRLGYSRDRVFRIAISDPVKIIIIGAQIEVSTGVS